MATNKNAQLRYQVLDRCFSDFRRKYTIEDLMEEVNETLYDLTGREICLRQIREDIKYMRDRVSYDAPIVAYPFDGKRCYYRYSDCEFSIFKNELSIDELSKLRSTIEMLGRYRGAPGNAWLEEVISSLEYRFGVKPMNEKLISFDQNHQLKGLEYLSDIIDATISHKTINITYRPYNKAEINCVVHPYYVKSYNGRWFVFGLQEGRNRVSNMALDRIEMLSLSEIPFKKNVYVDFENYFNDIIGVTIPNDDVKPETITLRFSQQRFPYIVSKPIHPSQHIVDESNCIIEFTVRPTKELTQQMFSFIPDVEVLSPEWYRQEICAKIKENLKKYLSVQNGCTDASDLCNDKQILKKQNT